MKNTIGRRLMCILLVSSILFGMGTVHGALAAEKKIRVMTDPRIELLTVVQWMVGYWPLSEYDFAYRNEISEHFGEYYMHPVLRHYVMMWFMFGFQYEIPYALMLHLSEPPELQVRIPVPKYILERMGGEKNLNDFLELLRDYAQETKFMDFYEDHRLFYKNHTDAVSVLIAEKDYIENLEKFFGPNQNSYTIILSPLVHEDGYGVKVGNTMYSIIGPSRSEESEPVFTDPEMLAAQVYHEFSQSFIGPLTSQNREEVLRLDKLFNPIMEEMMYTGYYTWELCYTEHLIRSVMNHILVSDLLEEEIEERKQADYSFGFIYSEYLYDLFREYLDNRDIYPNFSDFYPRVLDLMQTLCELPYAPAYLKALYTSSNGVQLAWKDNAKDETGYRVYRFNAEKASYELISGTLDPDITYFRDTKVVSGEIYRYRVSAVGSYGEIFTNAIQTKIPKGKPVLIKQLNAEYDKTEDQIIFQWQYWFPVDGFNLYEVTGERKLIETIQGDRFSLMLEHPEIGSHLYVMTAFYKEGEGIVESLDSVRIKVEVIPEE
ncbi:DUF4932 domain-containing protein [bacterium]|nr:DUF4932 domain-containing protein [bacterium]